MDFSLDLIDLAADLEICVRQVAWLHAPIDDTIKSRVAELGEDVPPLDKEVEHIFKYLLDIGSTGYSGMGASVPVSELEISAWQHNRGIRLSPLEAKLIKDMSRAYAHQHMASKAANCPSPWVRDAGGDVNLAAAKASMLMVERWANAMDAQFDAKKGKGK